MATWTYLHQIFWYTWCTALYISSLGSQPALVGCGKIRTLEINSSHDDDIISRYPMISKYCVSSLDWSANFCLYIYHLLIRWSVKITSHQSLIKYWLNKRWQTINNESHFFGFPPKKHQCALCSSSEVFEHGELTIRDFFYARPVRLWVVVKVLCVPLISHLYEENSIWKEENEVSRPLAQSAVSTACNTPHPSRWSWTTWKANADDVDAPFENNDAD